MNYELYRRSSLGLALTDALDELVQNQQLTPTLGLKVMGQFDKVITDALNNKVKVRANLKGHLHTYRFCDDVWTFIVENCTFKLDDETIFADKFITTMFQNRAEYDRGVNTFSPEGRLFQVEYAIEAIKLGSTAVGIQTKDGVILAVEKRLTSPLMVSTSVEKLFEIDGHVGCAVSGLTADAKMLVEHARVQAQHHTFVYNEQLRVESLTQAVCDLALRFGETGTGEKTIMSRPFGVALLVAGVDEFGSHLFFADPSGTFMKYQAKAIGSGSEVAQNQLQEEYKKDMSFGDAEILAVKVLKQVMEEKLNAGNVQVASVTKTLNFKIYSVTEVQALIDQL